MQGRHVTLVEAEGDERHRGMAPGSGGQRVRIHSGPNLSTSSGASSQTTHVGLASGPLSVPTPDARATGTIPFLISFVGAHFVFQTNDYIMVERDFLGIPLCDIRRVEPSDIEVAHETPREFPKPLG